MSSRFTLGTRGSPLALAQANETRRRLCEAQGWDVESVELKIIRTSGDRIQDRPLAEAGGKGLFTKEIDAALLAGEVDAAVHSAKDLPTLLPEGVALAGFLPREDPRDALVSAFADTIEGLPRGATFGAASLRRQAQALRLRPDLRPELLRGNIETRLRKAEAGEIGATLLAMAGLKRLGLGHRAHRAGGRRGGPYGARRDLRPGDCGRARGRAGLPRRARRLVPDADRRARPGRGRAAPVPRSSVEDGRLGEFWGRGRGRGGRRGAARGRGGAGPEAPPAGRGDDAGGFGRMRWRVRFWRRAGDFKGLGAESCQNASASECVIASWPKADAAIQGTSGDPRSPGSPRRFAAREDGGRRFGSRMEAFQWLAARFGSDLRRSPRSTNPVPLLGSFIPKNTNDNI